MGRVSAATLLTAAILTPTGGADQTTLATAAIKVDQVGYFPDAEKVAYLVSDTPVRTFTVLLADGSVAFSGTAAAPVKDADSGDAVQRLDFSPLRREGTYTIDVPGVGRSWPFAIGRDVYDHAYYLTLRSYYGQRCGTAVDLGPDFPGYHHGICHTRGAYHPTSGKTGDAPSHFGWHDAGDYGRYVISTANAAATLMWTWELYGDRIGQVPIHIPESGNGVPDILNEVRWGLDWMLLMQDTDGGVWHKQTSETFPGFIAPDKDDSISYVIGTGTPPFKSTCATAELAATSAIAARVFARFDPAYAAKHRAAAERAWAWAEAHPNVPFANPAGVQTGEYADRECDDDQLWAAAELWRTTKDGKYNAFFSAHYTRFLDHLRPTAPPMWSNASPMGLWSYALGKGPDAAAVDAIVGRMRHAADVLVDRTLQAPYRNSMTTADYYWGSNSIAAAYAMQLLVADVLHHDPRYEAAAIENLHYLFGRNSFSISWVTQLGANPVRHPHHRPSESDQNAEPWPGLLVGGPNHGREDPIMARESIRPPAKMYLDTRISYSTNEVDIAWNAPLVFVLAGLYR